MGNTKDPTGKQHYCCSDDAKYCPTAAFLSTISSLEIWAEGAEGDFHLELDYIGADDSTWAPAGKTIVDGAGEEIVLVDFKGDDASTSHTWRANNDPVMGGRSTSTVTVENNVLNFTGTCAIVPSLKAPGFITAVNSDKNAWVDVSSCEGLKIKHKSDNNYAGFRLSFGHAHPVGGKFFAYGYKTHFNASLVPSATPLCLSILSRISGMTRLESPSTLVRTTRTTALMPRRWRMSAPCLSGLRVLRVTSTSRLTLCAGTTARSKP